MHLALLLFPGCGSGGGGGGEPPKADPPAPPRISSIKPVHGPLEGGRYVTISGSGFTTTADTSVTFGGVQAQDVTVTNARTITCITPPHPAGAVDVTVRNQNGSSILPSAFFYHDAPSILWLACDNNGGEIILTWKLSAPGDKIEVYRGSTLIDSIAGDAVEYRFQENAFGLFRYSLILSFDGRKVDWRDVFKDLGKVTWDPPTSKYTGFLLYLAEAIDGYSPYELLPYDDPEDFSFMAGPATEVTFLTLYENTVIDGEKKYYVAASTYLGDSQNFQISALTDPLNFYCEVEIGLPPSDTPSASCKSEPNAPLRF